MDGRTFVSIVPAVVVGVLYELFLGHRHDYTGHFAAGYGATFGAVMWWLKTMDSDRFARTSTQSIAPICVGCILLGALAEATAFRIAKFDQIDFCNQSLGAVSAAIAATTYTGQVKPPDKAFLTGIITGIAFLAVGACFTVA